MSPVGQYHLKVPYADSWKLIRHIRFLHNGGYLKQISHEGTEEGQTVVCILIKSSRISLAKYALLEGNLKGLGLVMI